MLTLSHLGKGIHSPLPSGDFPNNSITAKDIEMKFFKFNLTPIGVTLYIMTIFINLNCFHGNLFVVDVSWNRKVKKLAFMPGYWLDFAQIWCRRTLLRRGSPTVQEKTP